MHSNIVKENFIIKNLVFAIELLYHIYLILLKQIYKKKKNGRTKIAISSHI